MVEKLQVDDNLLTLTTFRLNYVNKGAMEHFFFFTHKITFKRKFHYFT